VICPATLGGWLVREAGDAAGDPLAAFDPANTTAVLGVGDQLSLTLRRSRSWGAYSGVVTNFAQLR
jgi:hypothetical protein